MAALTLPGSLLARLFHAKASAEAPAAATQPTAAGTGDAAFPALLEGLVGEQAAGQERNSGGHTRGKFTGLERLIARPGRVRLPDKDETDADLVTVRSMEGKPVVPEVRQAIPHEPSPVVPGPQIVEGVAPAEQSVSRPELRIPVETKVEALKIQLTAQAIAKVEAAPPEVRAAAEPGIPSSGKAQPRTATAVEPTGQVLRVAAPKLAATEAAPPPAINKNKDARLAEGRRVTGATLPDHFPVDTANGASQSAPPEKALPELDGAVPLPPVALHASAEQPSIESAPQPKQLATHRPATKEEARAARPSTVAIPERHQQTAGDKPAPPPASELEIPVSAALPVPEKLQPGVSPVAGVPPDVSPARSLTPNLLATDVKPASPSVPDELPPADHADAWLKSTVPAGAPIVNHSAALAAGPSTRSADSLAPSGAKVRTLSIASTDRGEVAFEVELRPTGQQPLANEKVMPQAAPASVKAVSPETAAIEAVTSPTAPAPREEVGQIAEAPAPGADTDRPATGERDRKQTAPERNPRPAPPVDAHSESGAALPGVKVSNWMQSSVSRPEGMPEAASPPDAAPARTGEAAAARMDTRPEVHAAAAHEIKLEVSGGERRVEVRLSERGGEVRVAVRTPDSHLAGNLRDSLPELTSRFAESGLRSEIWRPGGSPAGESRHAPEAAPGNVAQDAEAQSRGNGGEQQRDAQERQQRSSQEPKNDKEKGKDFAWLMSSLR